jgi:hypothetical protein
MRGTGTQRRNTGEGHNNNIIVVLICALFHGGCIGSTMGIVMRDDVAQVSGVRRRRSSRSAILLNGEFAFCIRPFKEGIVRGRT